MAGGTFLKKVIRVVPWLICLFVFARLLRAQTGYELIRVESNQQKGFQWPYYLTIPANLVRPAIIVVEGVNTGSPSDDTKVADTRARQQAEYDASNADARELGSPFLVPAFPRPVTPSLYTHGLDKATLLSKAPGYERIDLQLVAMIDDARARLAERGIQTDSRVFIFGFSASGSFANRFTLLHPDRVKAVSAGSPGAYPVAPLAEWKGKRLPFPAGVADLEEIVGRKFDLETFRKVPQQYYIGDDDSDDPAAYTLYVLPELYNLITGLFGGPPGYLRWPSMEQVYRSAGVPVQFAVYPGIAHTYGPGWAEIWRFFDRNRLDPPPPPEEKVLLYRRYFPYLAGDGWETDLTFYNTTEGVFVNGEVQAYSNQARYPLGRRWVSLPPAGREEIRLSREFDYLKDVAYLAFDCDSGFIASQVTFRRQGARASLVFGGALAQGEVLGLGAGGAAGVVLINLDSLAATVKLTAHTDAGDQTAGAELRVRAGAPTMGTAVQLLGSDPGSATQLRFSANRRLLVFVLTPTGDGKSIEALTALAEYSR